MNKKKLLWVSHSPALEQVGQSKVTREFCKRLCEDYDLRVLGWDHQEKGKFPYQIYAVKSFDGNTWLEVMKDFQPDVQILSHDTWRHYRLAFQGKDNTPSIKEAFSNVKTVGYFTIDGDPVHYSWLPIFSSCDVVVSPTRWGKEIIHQRYSQIPVEVIPYGVDMEVFGLEKSKDEMKKEVDDRTIKQVEEGKIKSPVITSNVFTCFFVGQNQFKKNIGAIIDAFSAFAKGKTDVLLILVTHSFSQEYESFVLRMDYDLYDLIHLSNVSERIFVMEQTMNEAALARLYGVSNVFLYPSIGEGFGLQLLEAMASKTIPIGADYSSIPEVVEDAGFLISISEYLRSKWNVRRAVASVQDLTNKLEITYALWKEKEEWKKYENRCYERAKLFSWDKSAKKMKEVIDKAFLNEDFYDLGVRAL